jgi:hypothetical protein
MDDRRDRFEFGGRAQAIGARTADNQPMHR